MKDRLRSRNAHRHARPGRGPFPAFQPTPGYLTAHKRHAELVSALQDRGLRLGVDRAHRPADRDGTGALMIWHESHRFDARALPLADRHYNRRKIGSPQFVPPGRCFVLLTPNADALWVTSWPFARYVRHAWGGAWVNSLFRNESDALSSDLIRQAVAATRARYGDPPELGIVSFVDASKTRKKRDPGRCYRRAGWEHVGFTKGGLWAFQQLAVDMPAAEPAVGTTVEMGLAAAVRNSFGEVIGG